MSDSTAQEMEALRKRMEAMLDGSAPAEPEVDRGTNLEESDGIDAKERKSDKKKHRDDKKKHRMEKDRETTVDSHSRKSQKEASQKAIQRDDSPVRSNERAEVSESEGSDSGSDEDSENDDESDNDSFVDEDIEDREAAEEELLANRHGDKSSERESRNRSKPSEPRIRETYRSDSSPERRQPLPPRQPLHAQTVSIDSAVAPESFRNLRACIGCKIVLTYSQFQLDGCPNCGEFDGEAEGFVSKSFSGSVAITDPSKSWMARALGYSTSVPGLYAMVIPQDITVGRRK